MKDPVINPADIYLVKDIPGYTPNISRLLSMMNYVRYVTLYSVKGLSKEELDFQSDDKSNSIGALLLHIASTEYYYQKLSFEERELNEEENKKWKAAAELGELGRKSIKGYELDYYLNILNEIREDTYELIKSKNDKWLDKEFKYYNNVSNNHHIWFHVFEDEINHRGQINWIKKRINLKKN